MHSFESGINVSAPTVLANTPKVSAMEHGTV